MAECAVKPSRHREPQIYRRTPDGPEPYMAETTTSNFGCYLCIETKLLEGIAFKKDGLVCCLH
jgi:hypothetical protein